MHLEIGAQATLLRRAGVTRTLTAAPGDWSALAPELAAALPAQARLSVRVADVWVRYSLLVAPDGIASVRDCRLLLDARFDALYGQDPADWLLQADWQVGRSMLACAMPHALRAALPQRLERMTPALLHQWNRHCGALAATGAWCSAADGMLTMLYWENDTMQVVRQQRAAADGADDLLALELARLGAAPVPELYWSGAHAPRGWRTLENAS